MADVQAGDEILAAYWPASVEDEDGTDQTNITNTSYAPGSPEVGAAFEAPHTGRVAIMVGGGMREDSATNRIFMTFELHEGSDNTGAQVVAPTAINGISTTGDTDASGDHSLGSLVVQEGLTPGTTYYARIMYQTEGGTTNDITHRRIVVVPLP